MAKKKTIFDRLKEAAASCDPAIVVEPIRLLIPEGYETLANPSGSRTFLLTLGPVSVRLPFGDYCKNHVPYYVYCAHMYAYKTSAPTHLHDIDGIVRAVYEGELTKPQMIADYLRDKIDGELWYVNRQRSQLQKKWDEIEAVLNSVGLVDTKERQNEQNRLETELSRPVRN